MKDTLEYRDNLLDAIFRGDEAQRVWKDVKPYFERAHDLLLDDLVSAVSSKADKEEILLATFRLTGLREIANAMKAQTISAKRARQTEAKLDYEKSR